MNIWFLLLAVAALAGTVATRPLVRWELSFYRKIGLRRYADFFDRIFDPLCTGLIIAAAILTVLFALLAFRVI